MSDHTEYLKKLAKGLLRKAQAAEPEACRRARHVYSDYRDEPDAVVAEKLTLGRAQHVVAVEHGFKSWEVLAASKPIEAYLAITMAKVPNLTDFGIGLFIDDRRRPEAQRLVRFAEEREKLRQSAERVQVTVGWLKKYVAPIKTLNDRHTSYGLKDFPEPAIGYITNGVFIAAAIIAGFDYKIRPGSPNVIFNMSEKSLKSAYTEMRRPNPTWREPPKGVTLPEVDADITRLHSKQGAIMSKVTHATTGLTTDASMAVAARVVEQHRVELEAVSHDLKGLYAQKQGLEEARAIVNQQEREAMRSHPFGGFPVSRR